MIPNLERLHRLMAQAQVDAIIATSPENVAYLAEYHCASHWHNKGTQVYTVVAVDESMKPFLVLPTLEIDAWAESPSWIADLRPYGIFYRDLSAADSSSKQDDRIIAQFSRSTATKANAVETLIAVLKEKGLDRATVALDETGLLPSLWRAITERLPHAKVVDGAAILRNTRMVKTPAEIELLAKAARINEDALSVAIKAANPGTTERDLTNIFTSEVAKRGGTPGFWTTNAGVRTGHVHTLVSDNHLKEGDLVKWDVGCTYEFYWADTARTKAVTTVTDEQHKAYEAILAGEQAAIKRIHAGVRAAAVFETAVETVRATGLPEFQRSHCGHGIGIAVYDPPLIQASDSVSDLGLLGRTDTVLEAGMVLCIETPYYIPGKWGITVEDTVLVTENGARLLTSLDRTLHRK